MNIGIITYAKYEERVLMDEHFVFDVLLSIVQHDKDYRKFQVVEAKGNVLLSTSGMDNEQGATPLIIAKIEKEVEQVGMVYDGYKTPSTTFKYRTTWKVNGGICKGKKDAVEYADRLNRRAKALLERFIEKRSGETK